MGFTEGRYATQLRRVIWKSKGTYNAAGIKIWPKEAMGILESDGNHAWLREAYGIAKK